MKTAILLVIAAVFASTITTASASPRLIIGSFINTLDNLLNGVAGSAADRTRTTVNDAQSTIKSSTAATATVVSDAENAIRNGNITALTQIKGRINDIVKDINAKMTALDDAVEDAGRNLSAEAQQALTNTTKPINDSAGDLLNQLGSLVTKIEEFSPSSGGNVNINVGI